jgi:hypothetical protein
MGVKVEHLRAFADQASQRVELLILLHWAVFATILRPLRLGCVPALQCKQSKYLNMEDVVVDTTKLSFGALDSNSDGLLSHREVCFTVGILNICCPVPATYIMIAAFYVTSINDSFLAERINDGQAIKKEGFQSLRSHIYRYQRHRKACMLLLRLK